MYLTKPVSFPKPVCISTTYEGLLERNAGSMVLGYESGRQHGCRCNTQQGTKLAVSFAYCMDVVKNGYFDHTRPAPDPHRLADRERAEGRGQGGAADRTPPQAPSPQQPKLVVVGS